MSEGALAEQDNSELLQALRHEEQWAASYLKSELQEAQINALKRYYGDPYGDEVEGLSAVTTREVYEIIQWLRPDLKRTFTAGETVFEFEGVTPEGDAHAQAASDLINHVFLNDNEGERELDAWIFDGLLQRVGIMACEWREAEYSAAQEATGLGVMQVHRLVGDRGVEIVEASTREGPPDEAHPDGVFYDLKIRRRTREAFPEVFCIAPEDFRIAARAVDLQTARYCGDIVRMMRGEAKLKWPGYAAEIESHQGEAGGFNTDERRAERFRDLEGWDSGAMLEGQSGEASEIEIMREYIRFDRNGDGYPELLRCYRLGDCLLESTEVDEHIYTHWTPNPVPHRFFGLGIADEAADIQRTKTVLLRKMLDSVYHAVIPRMYANTKIIGARGIDALLTVKPGVVIEGDGPAGEALQPIATPDLSASALAAMQWVDRIAESRTGVNRSAQPMDPDLLHDTAKGVELLQNAASIRKEEIARNLAAGLQVLGRKLYRLVHKHQNEARSVKISGQWRDIDPRAWEADLRCTVSVGLGTGAREKQLALLQVIQNDQVAWVSAYGPGTPVVTPQHLHNMVSEKMRLLGYKTAAKFFGAPVDSVTGQPFVPQPAANPDSIRVQAQIQEGQAKLQLEQAKAQQAVHLQAQKTRADAAIRQMEAEASVQNDAARAQLDAQVSMMKAEAEIAVMRERMAAEVALRQQQMQFEAQMAVQQFEFEKQIAREKLGIQRDRALTANGHDVGGGGTTAPNFGGKPG